MNERLRTALDRKIAAHNRLVTLCLGAGILAVALMWVALYLATHWGLVLAATVAEGVQAEAPRNVDHIFALAAAIDFFAYGIARAAGFHRSLRERGLPGTVLDLLLLPARITVGTLLTFRNHIRFRGDELDLATCMLERVVRSGRLPASDLPVEIPGERSRRRVVDALMLLDLIYLRKGKDQLFYSVANPQRLVPFLKPDSFGQPPPSV